jgi:Cof subfamily protein (haloacid dehalogenase superfamily)
MNNIRLVVSDLDGTLLSPEHTLTDSVKNAVRKFVAAGGLFTIATGRFGPTTRAVVDELDIELPYILCNGAVIEDRERVWETAALPLEELADFLVAADQEGIDVMIFHGEQIDIFRRTPGIEQFEYKENFRCRLFESSSSDWRMGQVQKVLLKGEMGHMRGLWEKFSPHYRQNYSTIQSEDDYLEIVPPNQSKGAALNKLISRLGIDRSEVLAVGNQLNDLDMLQNAGIGVAVANSHPELKDQADYVCQRSYGDGVVEAMDTYCRSLVAE